MKNCKPIQIIILLAVVGLSGFAPRLALASTITNVSVGDNFFSPASVSINVNDTVRWTWTGLNTHSSTGPGTPALWDTGLHTNGFTFSRVFSSAGTFAYVCTLHAALFNQRGSIAVVQAANQPPTATISAPTNNSVFVAPWTGVIHAAPFDSDGSVSRVDFFAGAALLGSVTNPAAAVSFTATNVPAGSYNLTAVATDNLGAAGTSAPVAIQVLIPVPITLSAPSRPSPASFQFLYTATPGLRYVVARSGSLPGFTPIQTNTASSSPVLFVDPAATEELGIYSVSLMPNP